MNMATKIPDGFREDAQGRLVPESTIRPIDLQRDELVREIVAGARHVSEALADFKGRAFGDIEAFVQMSAEEYGVTIGGNKGNIQLVSFDGRYKVLRAKADEIQFDERLQAAKALIDQCLDEWSEGARPELKTMIHAAFEVDKAGNINTGRILSLRRYQIEDERWKSAMKAIGEAVQVVGSRAYLRVYERVPGTDKYVSIPLDISGV